MGAMKFLRRHREFLSQERVARVATINAEGAVHIVPICFAVDGETVFSTVIEGSRRLENMRRRPSVSIVVDRYEEKEGRWLTLKGVLMYGQAEILGYASGKAAFMKGWSLLVEKYPQYRRWAEEDHSPKDPDRRRIMAFHPSKVVSWGFD
jgi:nitroimidazol reductase NimA-like FMN-containing flavoprotein (pyridoxamine 5'-phosphate oxidase superfamily)